MIGDKQDRQQKLNEVKQDVLNNLTEEELENEELDYCFKKIESEIVRSNILKKGKRIDGRKLDKVRQIDCDTRFLPRTHGSALFTRGETQSIVVTTLGTGEDEQIIDALHGEGRSKFLLHYNFPPYSVGETGRAAGPGRREIVFPVYC